MNKQTQPEPQPNPEMESVLHNEENGGSEFHIEDYLKLDKKTIEKFDDEENNAKEEEDLWNDNRRSIQPLGTYNEDTYTKKIAQICNQNNLKNIQFYISQFEKIKHIKGIKARGEQKLCILILCLYFIHCNMNDEVMTLQELKYLLRKNITSEKIYCKYLAKIVFLICKELEINSLKHIDLLPFIEKYMSNVIRKIKEVKCTHDQNTTCFSIHKKSTGRHHNDTVEVKKKENIFDDIFSFLNNENPTSNNESFFDYDSFFESLIENEETNKRKEKRTRNQNEDHVGKQCKHRKNNYCVSVDADYSHIHSSEKLMMDKEEGNEHDKKINESIQNIDCESFSSSSSSNSDGMNRSILNEYEKEIENNKDSNKKNTHVYNNKTTRKSSSNKRKKEDQILIDYLEKNNKLLSLFSCILYCFYVMANEKESMDLSIFHMTKRHSGENLYLLIFSCVIITFSIFNIKIYENLICECLHVRQNIMNPKKHEILEFFQNSLKEFLGLPIKNVKDVIPYICIVFSNFILLQMYVCHVIRSSKLVKRKDFHFSFKQFQIYVSRWFVNIQSNFWNVTEIPINTFWFFQSKSVYDGIQNILSNQEDYAKCKKCIKQLFIQQLSEEERTKLLPYNFDEYYEVDLKNTKSYISKILIQGMLNEVYDSDILDSTKPTEINENESNWNSNSNSRKIQEELETIHKCTMENYIKKQENQNEFILYNHVIKAVDEHSNNQKKNKRNCYLPWVCKKINVTTIHDKNVELLCYHNIKVVVQLVFCVVIKSIQFNCYALSNFTPVKLYSSMYLRKSRNTAQREINEGRTEHEELDILKEIIKKRIKENRNKNVYLKNFFYCDMKSYLTISKNRLNNSNETIEELQKAADRIEIKKITNVKENEEDNQTDTTIKNRSNGSHHFEKIQQEENIRKENNLSNESPQRKIKKKVILYNCNNFNTNIDQVDFIKKETFTYFDFIFNVRMMKHYKQMEMKCLESLNSLMNNSIFPFIFKYNEHRITTKMKKLIKMNECVYHTYGLLGFKKINASSRSFNFKNELNDHFSKVLRTNISNVFSFEEIEFLFSRFYLFLLLYIKRFCCFSNYSSYNLMHLQPEHRKKFLYSKCPCNQNNCCYKVKLLVMTE